jgi:hypothetical protein
MSHCHHNCEHKTVKFCKDCNQVYCEKCKETWETKCTKNHYSGWPYYYVNQPYCGTITISNGSVSTGTIEVLTTTTDCSHSLS